MGKKVTVIGAGNVGAVVAYTLVTQYEDITELLLIDINEKKAFSEALDIAQSTASRANVCVHSGNYADAAGSDFVIITSGIGRKADQSRLDLVQTNVNIMKQITPEIVKAAPKAKYIIVSNPVDITTYVFLKLSGLPEQQVIGTGTMLDTARLQCALRSCSQTDSKSIQAYVLGEHGDTSFIPWSLVKISDMNYESYSRNMQMQVKSMPSKDLLMSYVRGSGARVISGKGSTSYAIAAVVSRLYQALTGEDVVVPVSVMMHGEYGIKDIGISVLTRLNKNGNCGCVPVRLTEEETSQLKKSADTLREWTEKIEF